ncbi:MAG: PQQ-binding-like beta-propeller repeat protein [Candidatus Bathyarchaeia archaeon]|jgi:hypothetical protein
MKNIQKIKKYKALVILLTLFSIAIITDTLIPIELTNATEPPATTATWCYVAFSLNPVGVNQTMLIYGWTDLIPPAVVNKDWKYYVDITDPDGVNSTEGPISADTAGSGYMYFTPTKIGQYKIQTRFAGVTVPPNSPLQAGSPGQPARDLSNDTYKPSTSEVLILEVQADKISAYIDSPLPTDYWTRPVNAINRDWVQVMGNWLGTASGAQVTGPTTDYAYGAGPETAHAMWSKPYWNGGIVDPRVGNNRSIDYYGGLVYETYGLWPPIIMNGRLYYNVYTPPRMGWYCVDLYTGETNYFHNTTGKFTDMSMMGTYPTGIEGERLAFGENLFYENPNMVGGFAYLWSTGSPAQGMHGGIGNPTANWMLFDEFTGNYICSIANVSTGGTLKADQWGGVVSYKITGTGANQRILVWNSTLTMQVPYGSGFYRPQNITYDGNLGYSINKTISPSIGTGQTTIRTIRVDDAIYGGSTGTNNEKGITPGVLWKMSLKPGEEGTIVWNKTFTPPSMAGNRTITQAQVDPEDGIFLFKSVQDRKWFAYSLDTMQLVWESEPESAWNFYGMSNNIYDGKMMTWGYGGELLCYNVKTGEILWNYTSKPIGTESWYGNVPISGGVIADNKIYIYSTEHSPSQPYRRDAMIKCVNISNGQEIWNATHWAINVAISDGYLVALNYYDNSVYCYGKGPSATTVTADPKVSIHGGSVMVEGTVTDQSPGGRQDSSGNVVKALKDSPAIADEYMGKWMDYWYAQRPMPQDAKGVDVSISVIDPNGNYKEIGTATSDLTGKYGLAFTPEVPGQYQIIANFAGSKAYGASFATTFMNVDDAPTPAPTALPLQAVDNTMTIVGSTIAIIIAIAIVGVVLAFIVRKRP